MAVFTDIVALIPTLCGRDARIGDADAARDAMMQLGDADVVAILEETVAVAKQLEQLTVAAAGVIALRSTRDRGHDGLSAVRGHRSAVSLIQDVTGSTRAEAHRTVRVGAALLDQTDAASDGVWAGEARSGEASPGAGEGGGGATVSGDACPGDGGYGDERPGDGWSVDMLPGVQAQPPRPWNQPLRDALRESRLTSAQFDAITRGLGAPPEIGDPALVGVAEATPSGDASPIADASLIADASPLADAALLAEAAVRAREEARAAWQLAAEHLVGEAAERTVEELWQTARSVRDLLDPEGAEARFMARFEKRSFRVFRGQDGQKRASFVFDDEGEAFIDTVLAAALRPRRGGPRFVDPTEKAHAQSLADDPRSNDQLAYDLILDVLRAGTLTDAETVFGTRQAGVRLVQVIDTTGQAAPIVHTEDSLMSMPATVAEQHICDTGIIPVTVDSGGNALNVGREQRLFTPKQRIALAIRDGGCRWHGCDRPASYCEAHHIDEWKRDHGNTDLDRGILLCRYHHMTLHHSRWRITREGKGDFVLHHSSGERFAMRSRMLLRYAFGDIDPPPRRFHPAA